MPKNSLEWTMRGVVNSFVRTVGYLLIWYVLSVAVVSVLFGYIGYLNLTQTPNEVLNFDPSLPLTFVGTFIYFIVGIFLVELVVIYFVSKSINLSKIFLVFVLATLIVSTVTSYWGYYQPCNVHYCIEVFTSFLAQAIWVISASSIPVLFISSTEEKGNFFKNKKFWLAGVAALLGIVVLWFFSTIDYRADIVAERNEELSKIQQIYDDPSFPIFQPTYLPSSVGKISQVYVDNCCVSDQIEYIQYTRRYDYGATDGDSFSIIVSKPLILKSEVEYFQKDLNKFTENQKKFSLNKSSAYNLGSLTVSGYPAIILNEWNIPTLYLYRDGVRVEIRTGFILDQTTKQLSQEELVNVAESLERVDQ